MIPAELSTELGRCGIPRESGDDPQLGVLLPVGQGYSPRERG